MEQRGVMPVQASIFFRKLDLDRAVIVLKDLTGFFMCTRQGGRKKPPVYYDA